MEMTPDQKVAHDAIIDHLDSRGELITLGGFAGTGKTFLIAETIKTFTEKHNKRRPNIAFCAFTGKASMVMREKLTAAGALNNETIVWEEGEGKEKQNKRIDKDYCGTIHSLMYKPIVENHVIVGWEKLDFLPYEFIVVDEASMVPQDVYTDLASYGIPIVAVGDHGQLPPVRDTFNLMERPQLRLEKIHRQAADNPIIKLSMMAREEGHIPFGEYGEFVSKIHGREMLENMSPHNDLMILCASNHVRISINKLFRRKKGLFSDEPVPGDKLICLKNNKRSGIYNGMTGTMVSVEDWGANHYHSKIRMDGVVPFDYEGQILRKQFNSRKGPSDWQKEMDWREVKDCFDFGYCLTVHKAQGSESPMVILCEEHLKFMDDNIWRRWLYTGVTRSKEKLLILG